MKFSKFYKLQKEYFPQKLFAEMQYRVSQTNVVNVQTGKLMLATSCSG